MSKVKFIAEISSNHNRDLNRSKIFIKTAAEIGCQGVKFQLFKISQLFAPEILLKSKKHRDREKWELPVEFIPELAKYTHELGLEFACTPFYLNAVDELEPYVDFYKIASYELLWKELFIKCANTGKPLVFSIGMAISNEIESILKTLCTGKTKEITVMHCNSAYPTPIHDSNLKAISTLKDGLNEYNRMLNISFGWSDHTVSPSVIYRAVHHYNVKYVEFHLDLDGKGEEFSAGHCWLPEQISKVIKTVEEGYIADGSGIIEPTVSELPDRDWRADPVDGLRPLMRIRKSYNG